MLNIGMKVFETILRNLMMMLLHKTKDLMSNIRLLIWMIILFLFILMLFMQTYILMLSQLNS